MLKAPFAVATRIRRTRLKTPCFDCCSSITRRRLAGFTVPARVTADPAGTLGALARSVSVGTIVTPIGVDTTCGTPPPPPNWARSTSLCAISSELLKAPSGASGRLVRVRPPTASRS